MKIASDKNPVMSTWLTDQGLRLDAGTYLSGALETRKLIEKLPQATPLAELTTGHNGGLFNGPMFRRIYVLDRDHGVPFLGSKDMQVLDLSNLPLLRQTDAESARLSYLQLKPGMTLISCSGFNAGRRSYARPDMAGIWSSQDVLKVEPDPHKIPSGYLYTFLASRFGEALVKSAVYGTAVKHIEPQHIANLPVPRFKSELEQEIHDLVEEAAALRAAHQTGVRAATTDFFKSVGLAELDNYQWHKKKRDLGFAVTGLGATSLRALNFAPRAQVILDKLASTGHKSLGAICEGGQLSRGTRFKRVDSNSENGVQLIGQRQAFWLRPEGRWVARASISPEVFAKDESILIASQGTLGENEVFARPIIATGSWLNFAYSEHFLRITSADPEIPGPYLFAFLRSEAAFRVLRSMSAGGKQQDIHDVLRAHLPIPLAPVTDRERITETVRKAFRDRDHADVLEDEALSLLTKAIEEASA
ncbi:restriction endonuclease subunit S [Streptomyces sp. NPDC101490]|uniref:methylation-associated defense system restriction endonuclease subunit S MAD5 n=1 Tax=Streptomyces sp. NPDC101490 TaxID=3366143 RepID=UPI003813BAE8